MKEEVKRAEMKKKKENRRQIIKERVRKKDKIR